MPAYLPSSLPWVQSGSDPFGLIHQWFPPGSIGAQLWQWVQDTGLSPTHRPIRLRIQRGQQPFSGALVAHSFRIDEEMCASNSVHMRILGMCTRADLAPTNLLGMPVAVQMVTDRGQLRTVNGIITKAVPGQSDGGAQVAQGLSPDAKLSPNPVTERP